MRKLVPVIIALFFLNISIHGQDVMLVVQGAPPYLYLNHTVAPKENYYSVGRLYNVSPKELAPYNNLQFEKGFSLGQTIKIFLNTNNFSQTGEASPAEALVPIYHIIQAKEGLYKISTTYNKVSPELLKKWNHLKGESVNLGTKFIIGYLKVLKDQSAFAQKGVTIPIASKKKEIPPKTVSDIKIITVTPDKNIETEKDIKQDTKNTPAEKVNKEEKILNTNTVATNFSGGFFKKMYTEQASSRSAIFESGSAGTFKTTSGWQDGKYYCFHNTAPQGTIIKITNPATGKSVYAKVLDAIPDIKQNSGLLLRLSNSAAAELGAGENKFDCAVSYAK